MNQDEKAEFIKEMVNTVCEKLITDIPKMPVAWDGIELRQLIADRFADQVSSLYLRVDRKRFRAYRNDVLINNL